MRKTLRAAFVLAFLAFLPVACSSESFESFEPLVSVAPPETTREAAPAETTSEKDPGTAEGTTEETPPEPRPSLVPIAHLTSPRESVGVEELADGPELAVPGGSREEAGALIPDADFETFDSAEAVVERVSRDPKAVGLVPWDEVNPRVKALAVDGENLLDADSSAPEDYALELDPAEAPDPERLRRVVVAGDVVLDRGLPYAVYQQGMGEDFPLDGGYAAVTERTAEPSEYSEFGVIHQFEAERRGEFGAIREYLSGADLALANFENPVLEDSTWHPEGTTFTGDLRLLPILNGLGIDGVTLANNHVLDAGEAGLTETTSHLEDAGIAHAGAGADLRSAREPMVFDLGGTKVGVLSYQNVPSYEWAWATESAAGTAPMREDMMREDIEKLRPEVDVLIVAPHWGEEYTATPEPGQVDLAHAAMDAGADVVVGGHAHWAKGMEVHEEKPIFYGTGNFLFDQVWSEETSTGIFAEITLYDDRVVQARPVPFISLDYAQPNFLLPKAGGDRALDTVFSTSIGPEFEAYEGSDSE